MAPGRSDPVSQGTRERNGTGSSILLLEMKRTFLAATLLAACLSAQAQIASLEDSKILAKKVIDAIAKGDADAFLALAEPELIAQIGEPTARGFVGDLSKSGTFGDPVLTYDVGEVRYFNFTITKNEKTRNLVMVLGAGSASKFYSMGLQPVAKPKEKPYAPKTDNRGKSELDKVVQKSVERYFIGQEPVGVSIGILIKGKTYFYNYGEQTVGKGILPTKNSVYEIGSITKTMTGTLLARAVLDKKIGLDDDIRKYLPAGYDHIQWEGKPVTFRHLATHTSGLPANPASVSSISLYDPWKPLTREKLMNDLQKGKLQKEPGTEFEYCNLGVGLLGHLVADRYGKSYEAFLNDFILKPAGMNSSGITLTEAQSKNYIDAHNAKRGVTSHWNVNGVEAAGAVKSDCADMLKFSAWLMNPKNGAAKLATTKSSPLSTGPYADMGLCWGLAKTRVAGQTYHHSGGTGGFSTNLRIAPERQIAVIVMTNSYESGPENLGADILYLASQLK